jgi:hypothetical protein
MNHYTDKDMTSEEFCNLLKDRLERGESIDGYSYSSSNGAKVMIQNSRNTFSKDSDIWIGIVLMIIGILMLSFL